MTSLHDHAGHAGKGDRPGLRHDASIRTPPSTATPTRAAPIISARPAAGQNSRATRRNISPARPPAEPVPEGAIYTCPMHPEVRQVGPGACPICGMALEPVIATADSGPNPELVDMTRRFWIGLALALPVFVLEMGTHLAGGHGLIAQNLSNLIQFALATPVVLWAGWPFFVRGYHSLVTRNLNMFTLIALGTGVAWLYSVVATFAPGLFPSAFRGHDGSVAVYFEAAAVITVLVLLGQVLELRAREATSGAIRALLDLAPKTARRVRDDSDEEIALDAVAVGDLPARAARRQGAGRRRSDRRPLGIGRIHGDRRIHAGDAKRSARK